MGAPRTRVLYQSEALFVSQNPATGVQTGVGAINQIFRVTSFNNSFSVSRQDVTTLGQLDPLDQLITAPPSTSADFAWLDYGIGNEQSLGFVCDGQTSPISGFLAQATDVKNYYLLTVPEGFDAVGFSGNPAGNDVIGIGNGYVSSYSTQGAVGGLPSTSVQIKGLNTVFYNSSSGQNSPAILSGVRITGVPFVLPTAVSGIAGDVAAIRPGDITLNLANASLGVDLANIKIQSYNLSLQLNRTDINALGSFFPIAIPLQPPFPATLAVEAELSDLTTGDLSALICNDALYDIFIYLRNPSCANTGIIAKQIEFRGAKLSSENFTSSTQGNKRISISYETRLTSQGTIRGVFLSGVS